MSKSNICKLCGKKANLIRKSHIIPEFMYKPLLTHENKMVLIDSKKFPKGNITQTGVFDKHILCEKCENNFSGFERYVSMVLNSDNISVKNPPLIETIKFMNVNIGLNVTNLKYHEFKMCFLSIVWRTHISSNSFFEDINIEDIEPGIKKILTENKTTRDSEYRLSIFCLFNKKGKPIKIAVKPFTVMIQDNLCYVLFMNGFLYLIVLKNTSVHDFIFNDFLSEDGRIKIGYFPYDKSKDFLEGIGIDPKLVYFFTEGLDYQ